MGPRRSAGSEPHYYSDRLRQKLERIRFAPATIVEAPSGYGKTTAIRDFLETALPANTPVYWFSAVDELPVAGFRRLCREIDKIDSRAGECLLKIELPNAATIGEACDALRAIRCNGETYLVIDNFQCLSADLHPAFLPALLEHGGEGLHIIIMTQMIRQQMLTAIAGRAFLHITAADLRLNAADIRRYYAVAGMPIAMEEAEIVAHRTEGWIIAVYLQLCARREAGAFSDTAIFTLMEHLVWQKLSRQQQDFLLRLSPFKTITSRQACALLECEALPEYALDALQSPFIRYETREQRYELHSLLSELLAHKRRECGGLTEYRCLQRAGDLCRNEGRAAEALGFYWEIKDYERMLAVDLSSLTLEKIGNTPFAAIGSHIAQNCPADIKSRYPLSMLRIAWSLLLMRFNAEFDRLMAELRVLLTAADEQEASWLLGEWLLLSSLREHPRLTEMTAALRQAEPLFNGRCSRVIFPDAPWCFGNYHPLSGYHLVPGEADIEAEALEQYIELYSRLTNGHGSGADVLYRAELAYHRGNIDEAEILAYKAVFLAESSRQSIVQLGATLQLAEIMLHKADTAGWQHAIALMERAASYPSQNTFVVRSVLDTVRGVLLNEIHQLDGIAGWLKNREFSERAMLPAMISDALFVHTSFLMHQGKATELIGVIKGKYADGVKRQPFRDMLWALNIAVGYMLLGNSEQAAVLARRAVRMALPDGLVFPIASYSTLFGDMMDEIVEEEFPAQLDRFRETKERYLAGWLKVYNDMLSNGLPPDLTAREYEVAKLAAAGMRNSEIAAKLKVTESTVRTHLRTVFQKLDVDRRAQLAVKLK